ncbi:DNA polymerase epsilon catalytic subunit [Batrachochytrium dendrobatidis]|nr:DNA polymerase epsilon catalytic subunit [Batrachochytrium dendrobatidis]KAK5667180.1 DNA polymerase epsilon catalytic subunit [Batrachochytrium dendrobatidis]
MSANYRKNHKPASATTRYNSRQKGSNPSHQSSAFDHDMEDMAGVQHATGLRMTDGKKESVCDIEKLANNVEFATLRDDLDEKMGFARFREGPEKLGWLVNIQPTTIADSECPTGKAGLDMYFIEEDGMTFKATLLYEPYFFVICKPGTETDVEEYIKRRFQRNLLSICRVVKQDLTLANHLVSQQRSLLKLSFWNVHQLKTVKNGLFQVIEKRHGLTGRRGFHNDEFLDEVYSTSGGLSNAQGTTTCRGLNVGEDGILELREYDIMYYTRVAIDCQVRIGLWYAVSAAAGKITVTSRPEMLHRAEPVILAFDIETTKLPLKFPDSQIDSIMMISYMIDGQGFLIVNREIVSKDIDDFEYTPKPEYQGNFVIFNEQDEASLLGRFIEHIQVSRPTVFVTYNGDFFDWPFVEDRCKVHNIDLFMEIGFSKDSSGEYKSRTAIHMDCFAWVKRDSYLPQGSQGLKAVTTHKLGYNPMEIDPEDMTRFAVDQPQVLAQYSVSDAVATYYLYMKYVNPFIFSLCTIIPMNPDDVLRRGSGTLCEHLLMVEAVKANVVMPNKHSEKGGKLFEGHLLESETYVGGHVEALEAGVFRSDIPTNFSLVPEALRQLIDEIDEALTFSITVEHKVSKDDVLNYAEVRDSIIDKLDMLCETPQRNEEPLIYHLDVAAMYPNIILTNRLQPNAVVDESVCAACDFNEGPDSICQRNMTWSWRGEYFLASRGEVNMIQNQLQQEQFVVPSNIFEPSNTVTKAFHELRINEQDTHLTKRVSEYSRKVYGRAHETKVVERESIVCQREHPFYVNTVRDFRDRRYEYKSLHKSWKGKLDALLKTNDLPAADEAKRMIIIYDSLQLAHKCILNSFYGYVMRKGARWFSMEMAGIVCLTGAKIIQLARTRVEKLGRPLELDTDGIWCILPKSFPENFKLKLKNGKELFISYPCVMLNHLVHAEFTNHQYQDLIEDKYVVTSENSIFFEVDGPYHAMILPASTQEDKLLKKRYAVFNHDGSLAELKGFEVKRRGELKLIKNFQSSIFKVFLEGTSLKECYTMVGAAANRWLDILFSKAVDLSDAELFDLISENRSMSKALDEYGAQKSTSIKTARRLAEFLGDQMVKDKGLACKFIISAKPYDLPVSERAIPIAIFQAESSVRRFFLRKWLKDSSIIEVNIRDILDWQYYIERFGSVIQKLITIPAAMQQVSNPIPRVRHPDWLLKRVSAQEDKLKQRRITDAFIKVDKQTFINNYSAEATESAKLIKPLNLSIEDDGSDILDELTQEERTELVETDYLQWLAISKQRWRTKQLAQAELKQAQAKGARNSSNIDISETAKPKRRIGSTVYTTYAGHSSKRFKSGSSTSATMYAGSSGVQLLEIVESEIAGTFILWVLFSSGIQQVRLNVPRRLYMNSKVSDPGKLPNHPQLTVTKRSRILPRNHTCHHLYELEMPESFYIENNSLFAALFNHPDVDGVYETNVTLLFRALIQMGCLCEVSKSSRSMGGTIGGISSMLSFSDIKSDVTTSRHSYLDSMHKLNFCYLFHASSGSRQVIGLFLIPTSRCHVIIVDSGNNRDAVPNVQRMYSSMLANSAADTRGSINYPEQLEITTAIYQTEARAFAAVNTHLNNYFDQRRGATALAIQSASSRKYFENAGITAIRSVPIITVPSHKNDVQFPPIGWQQHGLRRMFGHFLNLDDFITDRIKLARYADIPLCNIESDYTMFLSDVFMARRLTKADALLWFSLSGKPDLGGAENEDTHFAYAVPTNPEINKPGSFSSMCIEMDIWDLALNTILQTDLLHDMENPISSTSYNQHQVVTSMQLDHSEKLGDASAKLIKEDSYDEQGTLTLSMLDDADRDTISRPVYNVFRGMIKGWMDEVRRKNRFASHLLEHLYRWITSPSARFFDPALFRFVHDLMKRVFSSLVNHLRKLGSEVIYASFEKIVVSTNKMTLPNAVGYIAYTVAAMSKRDLFAHIEIKPVRFWRHMMWMDVFNWAGIELVQNESDGTTHVDNAHAFNKENMDEENARVDMKWSMIDGLPARHQHEFMRLVTEYLDSVRVCHATTRSALVEHVSKLLQTTFKRQLMTVVREFSKTVTKKSISPASTNGKSESTWDNGSYNRTFKDANLEFVKLISAVLGLDEQLEPQVRALKRDLLSILGVTQFSKSAVFAPAQERLVLHQVICEFCSFCRDLDLTRDCDFHVLEDIEDDTVPRAEQNPFWACSACHMEYDRLSLEQRLVDTAIKKMTVWQLQDVRCTNCRFVKAEDLRNSCPRCTSKVVTVQNINEMLFMFKELELISHKHGMEMLKEVAAFSKMALQ